MTALTIPDPARHAELAEMLAEYAADRPGSAHGSGLWNVPGPHAARLDPVSMHGAARATRAGPWPTPYDARPSWAWSGCW